jgi:hypothetical protein
MSCSSELRCLAGAGYDGPTGLGTPDGIAAFQPSAAELNGEGEGEGENEGNTPVSPPVTPSPSPAPTTSVPTTVISTPAQIGGLALTLKALISLDRSRPKIGEIRFTFLSNANLRVLASLQRRVTRHHHTRWVTVVRSLALTAAVGRNSGHLSGHAGLSSGTYRLTPTPEHAAAHSLVFKIG